MTREKRKARAYNGSTFIRWHTLPVVQTAGLRKTGIMRLEAWDLEQGLRPTPVVVLQSAASLSRNIHFILTQVDPAGLVNLGFSVLGSVRSPCSRQRTERRDAMRQTTLPSTSITVSYTHP